MLQVRNLRVAIGGHLILDGVDLDVAGGEFVSLVGPSGSGKSTILRAVVGLQPLSSGSVELAVPREDVGYLFQEDALLPWRTARQNVALGLMIRGRERAEALEVADAWLARFGLAGLGDRFPHQLSGGQRKRVALAQVPALRPQLLLMDEPFAALDAIVRVEITMDLLSWVERSGIAVLLVTHDLEEALALADRVALLSCGPGAHIVKRYPVPFPRPRDPVGIKADPGFGRAVKELWKDLEEVVKCAAR